LTIYDLDEKNPVGLFPPISKILEPVEAKIIFNGNNLPLPEKGLDPEFDKNSERMEEIKDEL